MAQRIHCIRAAVNKGYGMIHPELGYNPPYAFKPTHQYIPDNKICRCSAEQLMNGGGKRKRHSASSKRRKSSLPKRTRARVIVRIRT